MWCLRLLAVVQLGIPICRADPRLNLLLALRRAPGGPLRKSMKTRRAMGQTGRASSNPIYQEELTPSMGAIRAGCHHAIRLDDGFLHGFPEAPS
eukprot:scaffold4595_cov62-Phaeocystis_antarctica.AAC.2